MEQGKGKGKVLSLNVGKSKNIAELDEKEVLSAIYKHSVEESVLFLSKSGIYGDEQADLLNHGGSDKAVCIYPIEHYAYWQSKLKIRLSHGAFGENVTLAGLTEENCHIGDIFKWGEAVVQVSQPRRPCYKVAKRHQIKKLPLIIQTTGYSGYYVRVLQEGYVSKKDPFELLDQLTDFSIKYINKITYHEKGNLQAREQLRQLESLSSSWKSSL
ncbi:MOSC domain-containing protein [Halalkalibacter krulwichiae]|uniref:6-N-hydroxylaminopurine resistance protein n=1 Tax=Halalkalibacter krulwichiae TaxID=199441 RepID=A0A1X9MB40_9BACI|nr:MOSC domain-containing protein [Halalkalibacter krulwichiae]ARK30628.1 6-N-hydroxylaminopurine resistance protein [Halalkalibacter krulwichiae]